MLTLIHVPEYHLRCFSALIDVYAIIDIVHAVIYSSGIDGDIRQHGGCHIIFCIIFFSLAVVRKLVLSFLKNAFPQLITLVPT